MLKINQIKLPVKHNDTDIRQAIIKKLRIAPDELLDYTISKQSLDARQSGRGGHPGEIFYQYTVTVRLKNEQKILKKKHSNDISCYEPMLYKPPVKASADIKTRPVIIGSGPAGLFCGLILARQGYRPIILERGSDVHTRMNQVNRFWESGELNPECNVQFGEGGAGTFSDGKLNTLVKDPSGRHRKVLEIFVEAGAPENILYVQKPHVGTDQLIHIVEHIRNEIIRLGGEVYFDTKVTDIITDKENRLTGIEVNHNKIMSTHCAVLAVGHSARDTFETLYERNVYMEQKPFAIGIRIEHPQQMIDESQYGLAVTKQKLLPAASYKLSCRAGNGRNVYTFCMCPGGYVVNASSEQRMLAVNGMSNSGRDGNNANSAVIVSVSPEDFEGSHPLAGIEFQRKWERLAWQEGNGSVPVQLFEDFCHHRISKAFGEVLPEHRGAYTFGNLWSTLPEYVCEALADGIHVFGSKIKGYDRGDAILSGVETRTSSPLRILRDDSLQSNIRGFYPCGEGAGYAGGITSAAMDGLRVAEAVADALSAETEC